MQRCSPAYCYRHCSVVMQNVSWPQACVCLSREGCDAFLHYCTHSEFKLKVHLVSLIRIVCVVTMQLRLMRDMRESIVADRFPDFVRSFFARTFPSQNYPLWAVDALNSVNIRLQIDSDVRHSNVVDD